ncbi:MAG: AMP-binding protein [Treponema sp.]|jgi:long-chain acyl-CoA synthetase|nr:AMP-binding protein [Treponema sp.]
MIKERSPWKVLDAYRGTDFSGLWPTLPELFRINAGRFAERPCLTIYEPGRISLSYAETLARVEAIARWLAGAGGVAKGDRVAISGKNSPEWAAAYLGILFAGAVVVPIDYQLKNEETALLIKAAGAKVLFVDEEKYPVFRDAPAGLRHIISLKKGPGLGDYVYDIDGPRKAIPQAAESDLAAILFTSGTTGVPKGVMLTHQNLVADCYLAQGHLDLFKEDVFYALLPIHHSYTMLAVFIETLSCGAEVVFGKRMVTKAILKDLKEAKITMLLGVPVLFNKVLAGILRGIREKGPVVYGAVQVLMGISGAIKKMTGKNPGKKLFHTILDKASLTTLRVCICGGGPLAPSVFRKYNQMGIDFIQGYGLTETSPIITLNPIEHYKETSVGRVLPQTEMKVLSPDERGIGEIAVRGPMVMRGYYENAAETAAVFTEDGFLKTGDLGYLDSENYLYLTGRAKNMIVTEGGKNVYPEEIENEFQLFEEIDQILIRGFVQDKKMKIEGIEALVYPNPELKDEAGAPLAPEALRARIEAIISSVNQRLLPYQKIARTVLLTERMEETTTKKIKRDEVRA